LFFSESFIPGRSHPARVLRNITIFDTARGELVNQLMADKDVEYKRLPGRPRRGETLADRKTLVKKARRLLHLHTRMLWCIRIIFPGIICATCTKMISDYCFSDAGFLSSPKNEKKKLMHVRSTSLLSNNYEDLIMLD
jgi:hypothetical protein